MIHDLENELTPTCDGESCDRALDEPQLVFETAAGRREAHECACGAVTVTVARAESSR